MFCRGREATRKETFGPAGKLKADVKLMTLTWNVGNAPPPEDLKQLFGEVDPAKIDLVIIALQECAYDAVYEPFDEQSKSMRKRLRGIRDHFLRQTQVYLGLAFEPVVTKELGEMKIAVFANDQIVHSIRGVKAGAEATGVYHVLANKGGLVASLSIGELRIALISSHLAAHEGQMEARHDNVKEIMQGTMGLSKNRRVDVIASHHHVIWMGDLNYRTDLAITNHELKLAEHAVKFKEIVSKVEAGDWDWLAANDELQQQIGQCRIFTGFQEAKLNFHPTFKVLRQPDLAYLEQRLPSYCDRILWHSQPNVAHDLTMDELIPLTHVATSDHKPVRGRMTLKTKMFAGLGASRHKAGHLKLRLERLEGVGLMAADGNAKSDPYVKFTCLEPMLPPKRKYKTTVKVGTLNPTWTSDELPLFDTVLGTMSLLQTRCVQMHLFDSDLMSANDYLGSASVSLADLSTKGMDFDVAVVRFTEQQGALKGRFSVINVSDV
eukprot:TRINITY_DN11674_c3_g1_i3.p1 TRINITY_DN11674_c3_g1~~TRINITY_DN11674_c3_g1_i3.p1  ORF type:complete len:493 (+),score=109.00 TRINITY_DN11674_c3_g1_i3:173-1651(+)